MAKSSKPEKLFGRQISKVADQAEQEMGARADPERLAMRASEIAEESFGVGHDFTADYFQKRRQKAADAREAAGHAEAEPEEEPRRPPRPAPAPEDGGEGEVTISELRALRSKLGEDGTDLETLAKLLPRIEGYSALVGGLPRLRQAVEFLTGKD